MVTPYRITSPYIRTARVEPATLAISDFERWGSITTLGTDTVYQNAKLKIPVTVHLQDGSIHVYPDNAYVRIYETTHSIHLISKHPLP
jgi:hypothetical protein